MSVVQDTHNCFSLQDTAEACFTDSGLYGCLYAMTSFVDEDEQRPFGAGELNVGTHFSPAFGLFV
jgi:hypothetical protein